MKKIIKKALLELSKENPSIDYVRGLLEGLVEEDDMFAGMSPSEKEKQEKYIASLPKEEKKLDEASILDSVAKANIDKVKSLAEQSNG